MTSTFTQHLYVALLGVALISSCSRPVAYFQREPAASRAQTEALATPVQRVTTQAQTLPPVTVTTADAEVYALADTKLVTTKTLPDRILRAEKLLSSTAVTSSPDTKNTAHRVNGIERLLIKKLNKHIHKQLAPAHPEKAMLSKGKLIGGIVLLIGGLIMLIAGMGTVAFIGLILSLLGALGIIVGLFGI